MNGTYIYVDEKTLREYYLKYVNSVQGKGYEISSAIILKGFFELAYKTPCIIGYKIKSRYTEVYKKRPNVAMTVDEVKDLIELHKDEDDLADVAIAPVGMIKGNKNSAWVIQFKRFGHYQKDKSGSESVIEMLEKVSIKYTSSDVTLVILFDGHKGGLDPKVVSEHLKDKGFPFREILFIRPNKLPNEEWIIDIGEFWPNHGYSRYKQTELVKKLKDL